jgi:hypothetical protein
MWFLKNQKTHVKWDSQNRRNNVMGVKRKNLNIEVKWNEFETRQGKMRSLSPIYQKWSRYKHPKWLSL